MPPRDIRALLDYLEKQGMFSNLTNNLLTQWGPKGKPMLSTQFLPPRIVQRNQDTLDRVHFRTVAAVDGTRYSPAQLVDGGELFGSINYRLGHSDLARQITGPDYDGILNYLGRNMGMAAAGRILGIFGTMIVQAMVDHDEIANWQAIVNNKIERRGDNAYYEYEQGPDLTLYRVAASGDWQDPTFDPWASDIMPRIRLLTSAGYSRGGIRPVTSDAVMQILADNPATIRRSYAGPAPFPGQTIEEAQGPATESDVDRVFRKLKVQAPLINDQRIMTKTGDLRTYPEDHMTFIASTGRDESVIWNTDDPTKVRIVNDTLGFNAIGVPNGQTSAGRKSAVRVFTNQKDARIEMEGWQATGPVIMEPTAITDISGINIA